MIPHKNMTAEEVKGIISSALNDSNSSNSSMYWYLVAIVRESAKNDYSLSRNSISHDRPILILNTRRKT